MTDPQGLQRLVVDRKVLVDELRRLGRVLKRADAGEALFIHDVDRLVIQVGGAECMLPATGTWTGEVRVSASLLRMVARVPPAQDPVTIEVRDGRMRIAGSSAPCRWQPPGQALIEIPIGLDLRGRLRLAFAHPPAQLEASGLAPLVAGARAEMERRVQAAAVQLAPLGVSPVDVRMLVITRLGAQAGSE